MIVVVSGEGPTDVGGDVPGLLVPMIDKLAAEVVKYSLLEYGAIRVVSRSALLNGIRASKYCVTNRLTLPPQGVLNKSSGSVFFKKHAVALAEIAKKISLDNRCPVVAILFRDSDGSNSSDLWADKVASIVEGFVHVGFLYGVPMVPKPISEAWLICALRQTNCQCKKLEELSHSDRSPHSLKDMLRELLSGASMATCSDVLAECVGNCKCRACLLEMPSFKHFHDTFVATLRCAFGAKASH